MPYNKGDFTQQGVAGYVNGGLLLNNKRDVTAHISTDEESAGIDNVDIKIKDRLNDIEYHITGENLTEGENVIGGGGGVDNPVLTVNVVTTGVSGDIGAIPLLQINDNDLRTIAQMLVGGTTADYSTIVLNYYENGDSEYYWDGTTAYPSITGATATLTVSNEVNCTVTLNIDLGQFYAIITDPTQPASFTLTVS